MAWIEMLAVANLGQVGVYLVLLTFADALLWSGDSGGFAEMKRPVPRDDTAYGQPQGYQRSNRANLNRGASPGHRMAYSAKQPPSRDRLKPAHPEPNSQSINRVDRGEVDRNSHIPRSHRTDIHSYPVTYALPQQQPYYPQNQCICNCNNYNENVDTEGVYCEWKMVFKAVQGNGRIVFDDWTTPGGINEGVERAMDILSELPYRDGSVLDNWNMLSIRRARIEVFKRGEKETWFYFDATASSPISWMHPYRFASSPYVYILENELCHSSVEGEGDGPRFEVSATTGDCTDICGYLFVLDDDRPVCDFEELGTPPHFLYSTNALGCAQWSDGNDVGHGDRFVVSLKICDLDL